MVASSPALCFNILLINKPILQAQRSQWRQFFASLDSCIALERLWTLVLADPLANTFIAPVGEKLEDDPRLTMEVRCLYMCRCTQGSFTLSQASSSPGLLQACVHRLYSKL